MIQLDDVEGFEAMICSEIFSGLSIFSTSDIIPLVDLDEFEAALSHLAMFSSLIIFSTFVILMVQNIIHVSTYLRKAIMSLLKYDP